MHADNVAPKKALIDSIYFLLVLVSAVLLAFVTALASLHSSSTAASQEVSRRGGDWGLQRGVPGAIAARRAGERGRERNRAGRGGLTAAFQKGKAATAEAC